MIAGTWHCVAVLRSAAQYPWIEVTKMMMHRGAARRFPSCRGGCNQMAVAAAAAVGAC